MKIQTRDLKYREDERGYVADITETLGTDYKMKEVLLIVSKPNAIRGNHYHKKKDEWFCILKGSARFLYKKNSTGEEKDIIITGGMKKIIRTPILTTHTIQNIGSQDLYMLEFSNKLYKDDPDTFPNKIL